MKKLLKWIQLFPFILLTIISCSENENNESEAVFLDKIDNVVWTRGKNFKTFKSNPFKLFIVEDGICYEFSEGDTMVDSNKFSYSVKKNNKDTLQLGYKVVGERINHCGTFTYYMDSNENLIRTYKECATIYSNTQVLDYYISELTIEEVCSN